MIENKGDLISREALKKSFEDTVCIEPMPYAFVKQIIDNAPTVKSDKELYEKIETYKNAYRIMSDAFENEVRKNKRPQGEWTVIDYNKKLYMHSCSNLVFEYPYNFCPNCGADMRG